MNNYDNVKEFRKTHADEGLTKDQMNDLINQDQSLMELRDQLSRSEGELNYKRGGLI